MPRTSVEAVARDREASRLRAATRRASRSAQEREETLEAKRQYESKHREHINELRRLRYGADVEKMMERPFIGWDGEGGREFVGHVDKPPDVRHNYMLFGCSVFRGSPLVGRSLSTKACLEYLLYVESQYPDAFHVGFAFDYDVNMMLRDLPSHTLKHLAEYSVCHWEGYRIQYIRSKYFVVSRGQKPNRVSARIEDVFSFFLTSYVNALLKYGVAEEEELTRIIEGKSERGTFTWQDIEHVKEYWQDEISFMPPLMERIREACYDAGLYVVRWHGSGALAGYIIHKRGVKRWKSKDVPLEAQIGIQTAYAGGRFQPWRCGLYAHNVYTADINSAYIYACGLLPRLDNGRWVRMPPGHVDRENIARFGVYHISFDARKNGSPREMGMLPWIYPLFHRDNHNQVSFPHRTEGWYWSPEAELVANDPRAEFLEAWIFDDDRTHPFEWVHDEFNKRLALQHDGNPAEKAFKSGLAAIYGAFARRVGWDRKNMRPPSSHELAWAGFITSWCRAEMYLLGYECWKRGGLISIDTDGVTASIPFDPEWLRRGVGEKLGQWKLETWSGILYWQTGFYWLRDADGNWTKAKTRGVPRGTVDVSVALSALEESYYRGVKDKKHAEITRHVTKFVGFKEALNRGGNMSLAFNWETHPQIMQMGGGSTYKHAQAFCPKCKEPGLDEMHRLFPIRPETYVSAPHKLPWLEEQPFVNPNIIEIDLPIVHDLDV